MKSKRIMKIINCWLAYENVFWKIFLKCLLKTFFLGILKIFCLLSSYAQNFFFSFSLMIVILADNSIPVLEISIIFTHMLSELSLSNPIRHYRQAIILLSNMFKDFKRILACIGIPNSLNNFNEFETNFLEFL